MAPPKHNAIGYSTCDTCRYWHNPEGQPMGLCIANPPTPIVVGMQEVEQPAIVRRDIKQPKMGMPVVLGYFAPTYPHQGCGHHQRETSN